MFVLHERTSIKMIKPTKTNARIAGFLYLILIIFGVFSLLYVPSQLINWDSPTETLKNIQANELLFKLGILGDIIMYTVFLFLSFALYRLLKHINNNMAMIMVILVVISVSISYSNLIGKFDALDLFTNAYALNSTDITDQSEHLISLLSSHSNGISMLQIFWGLWLFPFGYLVFKSKFLPKFFGVLLMLGCFGYLTDFIGYFLFPESYGSTIIPTLATIPHALGEIGICLWLSIVGANKKILDTL